MESRLGEDVDIFFEKLSDAMERVDIVSRTSNTVMV